MLILCTLILSGCSSVPTLETLNKDAPKKMVDSCNDICYYVDAYDYSIDKNDTNYICTCVNDNNEIQLQKAINYIDYWSVSTVYIPSHIINEINNKFNSETLEFEYCLFGKTYKDGLLIDYIQEAKYETRTTEQVNLTVDGCPPDKIGYIHSHPNGNCRFSGDDVWNLNNEKVIEGISCGTNRITLFTYKNSEISLKIVNTGTSQDITLDVPYCPIGGKFCQGECYTGCTSQGEWHCDIAEGAYCLCDEGVDECSRDL